jgi:hypothetical protein
MSTLFYPQLTQFPVVKRRKMRTIVNRSADGRVIALADAAGETTEWQLQYSELSDSELATLETFFASAEGTLNGFTFLDPESNLLAYSGTLDNAAWAAAPELKVTAQQGYYTLQNNGAAAQGLTQTLGAAPAGYLYCLSADVRAAAGTTVTMLIGSQQSTFTVGANWQRIVFAAADTATFGLQIAAGASVDVNGMQAEAQAGASVYRATTSGGVYEGARLGADQLEIVTAGPNRHGCTLTVIYNSHL